jgi:WD40 repeat protein
MPPDLADVLSHRGELAPAELLDLLRADQEKRWQRGQPIAAEDYLGWFPALAARADDAAALLYAEVLLRTARGEQPEAAEYLARFPQYAELLWRQFELQDLLQHCPTVGPASEMPTTPPPAVAPASLPNLSVPGYEILGELGRGGMGVVYQARQVGLNRLVALKVLLAGAHADGEERGRFRREAETIARLHHPNVIRIYEVGETDGLPYFSMEFCRGGSLAQKLAGKPLPPREAATLTVALARGIQAAHRAGVIHRDLKPANVLLGQEGTPRISDFGLAKKLDGTSSLTAAGAILGTPSYMAPEQAGRAKEVGPAADVWALGAILYECLTGRPPFHAATRLDTLLAVLGDPVVPPSRLRPRIPPGLEAVCLRCLEKDPRGRYPSAEALAEDLDAFLAGDAVQDRRPRRRRRSVLPRLRRVALAFFGIAVCCLMIASCIPERAPRAEFPAGSLARLSPFGRRLLVADGRQASLWDTFGGQQVAVYESAVAFTSSAFSADGNTLALGDGGGEIELWDLKTGVQQTRFAALDGPVGTLVVGPEGEVFAARVKAGAAAGEVEAVRRWKAGQFGPVLSTSGLLSPDGRSLLETAPEGLRLWDTATAQPRATLPLKPEKDLVLAFSPNGGTLVSASPAREVRLWDTMTGKDGAKLQGRPGQVRGLLFSPDSGTLLTSAGPNAAGSVQLWDVKSGRHVGGADYLPHSARSFSPDGRFLIAHSYMSLGGGRGRSGYGSEISLHLWNPFTGRERARVVHGRLLKSAGHLEDSGFLAVSADGRTLLTGHWPEDGRSPPGGRLRVWDWDFYWQGRPAVDGLQTAGWVLLVVGIGLTVIDIRLRMQPVLQGGFARGRQVTALAFRGDGRALAVGRSDGSLRLWDLATEEVRVLAGPRQPGMGAAASCSRPAVRALAFYRGKGVEVLAVLDASGVVKLWDPATGREPDWFLCTGARVRAAAFSPDGRWVTAAIGGGLLRPSSPAWYRWVGRLLALAGLRPAPLKVGLWDLAADEQPACLETDAACFWGMTFAPSGPAFAAMTESGLRLYRLDAEAGRLIEQRLAGQQVHPQAVPAFPDEWSVVVRLRDGALQAYDVATGQPRGLASGPTSGAAVVFAPDRHTAATLNGDGTASLWDLEAAKEESVVRSISRRACWSGCRAGPAPRCRRTSPDGRCGWWPSLLMARRWRWPMRRAPSAGATWRNCGTRPANGLGGTAVHHNPDMGGRNCGSYCGALSRNGFGRPRVEAASRQTTGGVPVGAAD